MGTLVDMLHEHSDDTDLLPQPGLEQLGALVEQSSGAGMNVILEVRGPARELPPGLQVSLYRIVQESLTNVRKHSSASTVQVRLTYADDQVMVEICDDGVATGHGHGGQRGIVGMRERVAIYGGSLEAGPSASGGYRVEACVPVSVLL
jgi:signal transduction histidine kinase